MSSVAPHPPAVILSPGEASDLDEVMTIMGAAFSTEHGEAWTRSQCAGILPMSGVVLTIARDPQFNRTQGFSLLRTVADEAELLLVAVAPGAQRRGIGRALIDHFIEHAEALGAIRLHLEVRDGNVAAMLYRDAGFEVAGRRSNYYRGLGGLHFDALTLARLSRPS